MFKLWQRFLLHDSLHLFYSLLVNEPKVVYSYKRKYEYLAKKYQYLEQLLEAKCCARICIPQLQNNVVQEFVSQNPAPECGS
jgi:hypothetical protein